MILSRAQANERRDPSAGRLTISHRVSPCGATLPWRMHWRSLRWTRRVPPITWLMRAPTCCLPATGPTLGHHPPHLELTRASDQRQKFSWRWCWDEGDKLLQAQCWQHLATAGMSTQAEAWQAASPKKRVKVIELSVGNRSS